MRRIIDGKVYDTKRAEELCNISPDGFSRNDLGWEDTHLYVTEKDTFFLAGKGGPLTRWTILEGHSVHRSGKGMIVLGRDEARRLVEQHCNRKTFVCLFGEAKEGVS